MLVAAVNRRQIHSKTTSYCKAFWKEKDWKVRYGCYVFVVPEDAKPEQKITRITHTASQTTMDLDVGWQFLLADLGNCSIAHNYNDMKSGSFFYPQPLSLLILLSEPGSERKVLAKET